jgi:hypothetical protein
MILTWIGAGVVVVVYAASMGLVFWSRHIVERIHRRRLDTLRKIRREARNGQ